MTADASQPARRARCARCDEPRERGAALDHPTREIYRCGRCGYLNVVAARAQRLPIPESLRIAGAQALRQQILDTRDTDGARALADVVAALASAARSLIDGAPAYALANVPRALWIAESELAKHGGRPQGNDLARTSYAKASALLFVLTARHGLADLDAPERAPATPAEHAFQQSFWPVATDAAAAGSILNRMLRGDVQVRIRDGAFRVELTDLGLDTDELALNRRDAGPNESYRHEQIRALRRALALRAGIDLQRLLERLLDANGNPHAGIVTIAREATAQEARTAFDAFQLTADRVRTFRDAWFLDLGPRRSVPASEAAVAMSLVTRNWSAYYPVFAAVRGEHPIYMMGPHGVAITLDNLMTSKNRLLQELTETIPRDVPAGTRKELRAIRTALNRHAETRAQAILTSDGWIGATGQHWHVGDANEEIDVLAARARPAHVDVVVGEVKDFDFTLHRISGPSGLARRVREAEAQLARKQGRVLQSISGVLQRLGFDAAGRAVHVHALLIVSDAPPPGTFTTVDGVDFAALARFSQLLDDDRDLARRLFGRATHTLT